MKAIDITGQRFGNLTVITRVENKGTAAAWHCVCDCGNPIVAVGVELRKGNTTRCKSCARKKRSFQNKKNLYHPTIVLTEE